MADRVDWQGIRDAFPPDSVPLFALPARFAQMVLAVVDRLGWRATYRIAGYDYADWDLLDATHAAGVSGLLNPMSIQPILDKLSDIETAIYATMCCLVVDPTGGAGSTDPVTEGEGDVPPNVVSSGYATGPTDWAGFRDYKCDAAHALMDSAQNQLNALKPVVNAFGLGLGVLGILAAIAAVVSVVATGGWIMVVGMAGAIGAVAGIYALIAAGIDELAIDEMVGDFDEFRSELVCAIMASDGALMAADAVRQVIDENFTLPDLPKLLDWTAWLRTLYAGRYGDTDFAEAVHGSPRFNSVCNCEGEIACYMGLRVVVQEHEYTGANQNAVPKNFDNDLMRNTYGLWTPGQIPTLPQAYLFAETPAIAASAPGGGIVVDDTDAFEVCTVQDNVEYGRLNWAHRDLAAPSGTVRSEIRFTHVYVDSLAAWRPVTEIEMVSVGSYIIAWSVSGQLLDWTSSGNAFPQGIVVRVKYLA